MGVPPPQSSGNTAHDSNQDAHDKLFRPEPRSEGSQGHRGHRLHHALPDPGRIDRGVDVLIATPGRLIDHFERGKLLLTGVEIMVVDEADRMLDMGFIPDIERIFEMTPFTRQTLFFSATMAPEIERITNKFLSNPEKIEVERQNTTSQTITQILVEHTSRSMAIWSSRSAHAPWTGFATDRSGSS
mgnify:CR=1 FL=1